MQTTEVWKRLEEVRISNGDPAPLYADALQAIADGVEQPRELAREVLSVAGVRRAV